MILQNKMTNWPGQNNHMVSEVTISKTKLYNIASALDRAQESIEKSKQVRSELKSSIDQAEQCLKNFRIQRVIKLT